VAVGTVKKSQEAIDRVEPRAPWRLTLKDGQLVPKGQDLHVEVDAGPDKGPEGGEQGDGQRGHAGPKR